MAVRQIQGIVVDVSGAPVVGAAVECELSVGAAITSTGEIAPQSLETTSDGSGRYAFNVYANSDLTPTGTSYLIRIDSPVATTELQIVVTNAAYPSGQTWFDVASLVVAVPPTPGQYVQGPQGVPGPPGGTPQPFPFTNASTVTCNHNLGRYPVSVTIIDGSGNVFQGGVSNPTLNQTVVSFNAPQTGTVYIT